MSWFSWKIAELVSNNNHSLTDWPTAACQQSMDDPLFEKSMMITCSKQQTTFPLATLTKAKYSRQLHWKSVLYLGQYLSPLYDLSTINGWLFVCKIQNDCGQQTIFHLIHRCQSLRFFRNCYEFRTKITVLRSTVYLLQISDYCWPVTVPHLYIIVII